MSGREWPTFCFIGGQRCATTWVHSCLKEHPEVFVTEPKEVHFFNRHFDKGIDWYLTHFRGSEGTKAAGEITPDYLSCPDTPRRMYDLLPGVKLLCCLRNPVERAYSAYELKYRDTYPSFASAIEGEPCILQMGLYADHLERWFEYYPKAQMQILFFEDLKRDAAAFLRSIYEYIDVDVNFRPTWLSKTMNTVIMPGVQRKLKAIGAGGLIRLIRATPAGSAIRRYYRWQRSRGWVQPIDAPTKRRLLLFYESSIKDLAALLSRDLEAWLTI